MGYRGFGLFLDLDMLLRGDISNVFEFADSQYAVQVVKNSQRFEWASAILFNCAHPANALLTPAYVDNADACQSPHLFDWLTNPSLARYRRSGITPWATTTHGPMRSWCTSPKVCLHTLKWRVVNSTGVVAERDAMCTTQGWTELMGHLCTQRRSRTAVRCLSYKAQTRRFLRIRNSGVAPDATTSDNCPW